MSPVRSTRCKKPLVRLSPDDGQESKPRPSRSRVRSHTSRTPAPRGTRTRTGTVVTAIQGRDYARIYVKDLDRGRSSVALSPEEQEAVDRAMAR